MNFDIRFDFPLDKIPLGGVFMTEDGDVYQRIDHGGWRGLYFNLRRADNHATNFLIKSHMVHRIMTPLTGVELVWLAGWYAGRYHEMKRAQQEA